jgi:PAS domain S-box-containing protein
MPPQNIGKFFQSIIENINLGIIVVNEKGNVVYVNPAYEPFIGKSVSELMGKHISEVVDEVKEKGNLKPNDLSYTM